MRWIAGYAIADCQIPPPGHTIVADCFFFADTLYFADMTDYALRKSVSQADDIAGSIE